MFPWCPKMQSPQSIRTPKSKLQLEISLCPSGMCNEVSSTSPFFRMCAQISSYEAVLTFRAGTFGTSFA